MTRRTSTLAEHLESATRGLLYALIFLLPLWFLPFTIDVWEVNKQSLLLILVFAATLTWVGSMLFAKRFKIQKGWTNLFPLLFLVGLGLSAAHSSAPYLSWVGGSMQEYSSFLTGVGLVLLFYLLANTFQDRGTHKTLHGLMLLSAVLTGILGVLSIFDVHLFSYSFAQTRTFNTVGTVNALAVFLVAMTVFGSALWVTHKKNDQLLANGASGAWMNFLIIVLHVITIVLLLAADYWVLWTLLIVGMALIYIFAFFRAKDFVAYGRMWLPTLMIVIGLPFLLWLGSPFGMSVPSEVTLSYEASKSISDQTLANTSSSYGSGPGTYAFNYAHYHDAQINETDFWNTRFDRAASFTLTALPTTGYLGVIFLDLLALALLIGAIVQIARPKSREQWLQTFVPLVPWLTLGVAAALYAFNMTLMFMFFAFSGLLASQIMHKPLEKSYKQSPGLALSFSTLFVVGSIVFFVGIFVTSERYIGEAAFAKAVRLDRQDAPVQDVVKRLDQAATLNRFDDRYYRTLSEALLLQVGEQLESVPNSAQLTQESRQYIQSLVGASVNAAVRATDLSPENPTNWNVRGRVYRELVTLIPEAAEFSVSAHTRAVELEPVNPLHWNELGKTLLAVAEQERALTVVEDQEIASAAQTRMEERFLQAEKAFTKATELKPNYAPAHFQLGLTFERQGRLDDAINKLASIVQFNPLDVGAAFQLGQLYLRRGASGDLARSQEQFETAVELAPAYANARWFLASVYERQGKITEAVIEVEAVLKLNPDNAIVKNRLDRLLRGDENEEVVEPLS